MAWAYAALPWLGALACLALLLWAVVHWPWRFDVNARARGEADGRWVVAGGASVGWLAVAFVWAAGMPLKVSLLVLGRKLAWKPHWSARLGKPVPRRIKTASRRAWGKVDPLGLLLQLFSEHRHLRLRYLVLDLDYGFRDPLLTGRLMGALAMLSGVLPRPIEIRQRARWDFEDGWAVELDGRAIVKPWLVLLDMLRYVLKRMTSRSAPATQPLPSAGLNELR